jgi:hypothetical protein
MRSLRFIGRANKNNVPHMTTRWAGRDDGISPDEVHPGEGRFCGEAQAKAIALKGLDIMDTQTLLIIIVLVLLLGGGGWYGRGRWF